MKNLGAVLALSVALLLAAPVFSPLPVDATTLAASPQEEGEKKKKKGLRKGAATGAIAGLALGAVAGEAAAGAAVGAAVGAASGAWYDYDQDRQDDRTQMLADGLAGRSSTPPPQGTAPPDPAPGETVGAMGHRHMKDFLGDWNVEIWALDENRERMTASGKARGMQAGENAT
ncbi:MAG: hypothetical protein GWO02_13960, partial [Gammaproteobacteria bacterium]|nr:hypothetical protein [Gammaproteobacteria bacterium]